MDDDEERSRESTARRARAPREARVRAEEEAVHDLERHDLAPRPVRAARQCCHGRARGRRRRARPHEHPCGAPVVYPPSRSRREWGWASGIATARERKRGRDERCEKWTTRGRKSREDKLKRIQPAKTKNGPDKLLQTGKTDHDGPDQEAMDRTRSSKIGRSRVSTYTLARCKSAYK